MYLGTKQDVSSCDRTNVYMYHLDHLLQLPWAHQCARRPPKPRASLHIANIASIAARVKVSPICGYHVTYCIDL